MQFRGLCPPYDCRDRRVGHSRHRNRGSRQWCSAWAQIPKMSARLGARQAALWGQVIGFSHFHPGLCRSRFEFTHGIDGVYQRLTFARARDLKGLFDLVHNRVPPHPSEQLTSEQKRATKPSSINLERSTNAILSTLDTHGRHPGSHTYAHYSSQSP